jgi:hypothetical protein
LLQLADVSRVTVRLRAALERLKAKIGNQLRVVGTLNFSSKEIYVIDQSLG